MNFGIFCIMQHRDPAVSAKQVLEDAAEQTVLADSLGFHSAWFAEHHFSNYSLCPSPLTMVAHMAGKTKNIRLGTGVIVAPLYEPARLLGEIGFVDTLSGGRLELGIGCGYQEYEFRRFGVTLDEAPERTTELWDAIETGLMSKSFKLAGKYYQLPESAISIKPIQGKIPPMSYAGGNPEHLKRAALRDYSLLVTASTGKFEKLLAMKQQYQQAAVSVGKDPEKVKIIAARMAFCTDNKSDVEEFAKAARYQSRLATSLRTRNEKIYDDYFVEETVSPNELPIEEIAKNLVCGDVETCIKKLVEEIRALNPSEILLHCQMGGIPINKAMRSYELFATQVIPAVRQELDGKVAVNFGQKAA